MITKMGEDLLKAQSDNKSHMSTAAGGAVGAASTAGLGHIAAKVINKRKVNEPWTFVEKKPGEFVGRSPAMRAAARSRNFRIGGGLIGGLAGAALMAGKIVGNTPG